MTDKDEIDLAKRLGVIVRARRKELNLTQADIQEAGGPSTATLRLIEGGKHTDFRLATSAPLEEILKWKLGSIKEILRGGNPTPSDSAGPLVPPKDGLAKLQHSVRHTWSTATNLADAVLASGPSAALIQAAVAIGSVLSQILADRVIAADVSSEARDALLEEVYAARSEFRRRLLMSLDESEPGGAAAVEAGAILEAAGDDAGVEDAVNGHQQGR